MANIFKNLMSRLNFERYYVQGGDWGGIIVQIMASLYPNKIIGMHSNICFANSPLQFTKTFIGNYFPSWVGITKEDEDYLYPMKEKYSYLVLELGYMHLQATKPDTVGKLHFKLNNKVYNFLLPPTLGLQYFLNTN